MSKHQEQIIAAAKGKPRGATTAAAGGGLIAGEIGARWAGKQGKGAEVLSTVPLAEVDSLEVKRMGLTGVMEISAGGSSFKLEGKPGDMKELAEAFARAKAGGGVG